MTATSSTIASEQRTLVHNLSWATFEILLTEMGENRATRLIYDHGTLEIMSPMSPHERSNRQMDRLILVLAEEMGLNILSLGSFTCKREDLRRGAEPDSSYYLQNEPLVRDKEEIDLAVDPPPDLVLEVEYSISALDKLEIYAALGVPEFWRYNGRILRIYCLNAGKYIESVNSSAFAPIPVAEMPRFLAESKNIGEISMIGAFRTWVRQQIMLKSLDL